MKNLNKLNISVNRWEDRPHSMEDHSCVSDNIEIVFKNIKQKLISQIKKADLVLGCVAWLTDPHIIKALSTTESQIIVQKEDFLRPDIGSKNNWKEDLRARYAQIKCNHLIQELSGAVFSFCGCNDAAGVRCVGNHNSEKSPAFPRMHHKFLVLCDIDKDEEKNNYSNIIPKKIWTGSFNFTKNAGHSLENGLIIKDGKIAKAYFEEYLQILGISEVLDWENDWITPEVRIGS